MYGHRCQDTQSPFRVRAGSFRVTSSLITRVWTEINIIKFLWLIDTEWRHKMLYCYTLQAKQLVTLGTPSSGSWLCQQSSSSQAGLGTAWPEHQERGETRRQRGENQPWLLMGGGGDLWSQAGQAEPLPDSWLPDTQHRLTAAQGGEWREPGADPVSHQRATDQATPGSCHHRDYRA